MRNFGSEKKKLVVCGESFSYGTGSNHWPKIVAQKTNRNLTNLALVGCSNYAICFQLQHALSFLTSDDLVVISLTAVERFEIDDDEFNVPASLTDFRYDIDEITYSPHALASNTITSGNLESQLRNFSKERVKKYLMVGSYRLLAQYQSWAIQHLLESLPCKYIVYRNIYPRYHEDNSKYKNEHYFGLEKYLINSGPYDFELEYHPTTNHLNDIENLTFALKVVDDLKYA